MSKWERAGWLVFGLILSVIAVHQTQVAERVLVSVFSVLFLTMAVTGKPKH
jgi:hypothetical protein